MNLLNKYVIVKLDKPIDKIGSIYVPETAQIKINKGKIIAFDNNLKELKIDADVTFMDYVGNRGSKFQVTHWIDKETCITPYTSLNSINDGFLLKALGSKILVRIDKEKQKSNRFVGSMQLMMPKFNNTYAFNNQYGECISIGENVKEDVKTGDIAIFNQFIEQVDHNLVETLPNGDEIRVVETGTEFNYEWYGYIHNGEFISNNNYVFVEESKKEDLWKIKQDTTGLFITEGMRNRSGLSRFTVFHSNQKYKKGDTLFAQGQSASIDNLYLKYIHDYLVAIKLLS